MWFTYQGTSTSYPTWRKLWHDSNDGSGSGLDADTVDGIQGGSFLRSDANDTYTGTLSVAGTIQDSGDSRRIHYMYGTTNSQPAFGLGEQGTYGMKMRWDSGSRIEFDGFWNTSVTGARNRDLGSIDVNNANWELPSGVTINGSTAWHAGNDGSGSGLDADLLDGQQGSYYAIKDHFRHTGHGNYTSGSTAALLTEALGDDAFDSKLTAHKTSWSCLYITIKALVILQVGEKYGHLHQTAQALV